MVLLGYRVKDLAKKTWSETLEDNVLGLAAQSAYNLFFSIFPFLLFIAPLLSLVGNKEEMINGILSRVSLPPPAMAAVTEILRNVIFSKNAPGLISAGALLAAYSGSNVFTTFIDALNTAYDVEDKRSWWKKRLIALGMLIAAAIIMGLATYVMLAGEKTVTFLTGFLGISAAAARAWTFLQFQLAFLLLKLFLWLMYVMLPYSKQSKEQALVGAVFAALLWIVATLLFRLYVQNFGAYNPAYGMIGAVMILLTWMYLSSVVILVGGELNSEIVCGTGAVKSRAGAVYAGRIATGENPGYPSTEIR
jgi:membrane protein